METKSEYRRGVKDLLKNIDSFRDAPIWTPKIRKATKVWFKFLKKLMKDKILINKKEIDKKIAFLRKKQKKKLFYVMVYLIFYTSGI